MSNVSLKDAEAGLSRIVDRAAGGEFVTVTRDGRPAAVVVSVEAAERAGQPVAASRQSLVRYLRNFPEDIDLADDAFARNPLQSRDLDR